MLFGLTNILVSFERFINKIFAKKLNIFVIIYLDVIFIYINDDGDDHIAAIWWVLKQLRKYLLYANQKKCQFYQREVWFLGYVIFSRGICMKKTKIEIVK